MIGKKPTRLSLEEMWDLEDKYTAFVGRPTGAKILLPAIPPPQAPVGGATSDTSGKRPASHEQQHTVLKKVGVAAAGGISRKRDARAGEIRRKSNSGKLLSS
jgi:hypothetical protein